MWLFIKPLDVLFFRDGRSFTAGETSQARSLFPPSAYTLLGAIRSRILAEVLPARMTIREFLLKSELDEKLKKLREAIGSAVSYGQLEVKGPFLATKGDRGLSLFFPPPLDLSQRQGIILRPINMRERLSRIKYCGAAKENTDLFPLWATETAKPLEDKKVMVTSNWLVSYLTGAPRAVVKDYSLREMWEEEVRIGIKLNAQRGTAEEGMLYMAEFIRLKSKESQAGLLLEINEVIKDWLPERGVLALGGEGRAADYEVIEERSSGISELLNQIDQTGEKIKETGRFKLYLATPAIFGQGEQLGWLPDFVNPNTLEGDIDGVKFRLVAAAIGKPIAIGGWDLLHERPKDMLKAVPAGSVYFFELVNSPQPIDKLFQQFHFKSLQLSPLREIGFGISLVGTWDYLEGGD